MIDSGPPRNQGPEIEAGASRRCLYGADSLCWHARLSEGMPLETMLEEAAAAGATCLDLTLHYLTESGPDYASKLVERATALDLTLFASGHHLGDPRGGDRPEDGAARLADWVRAAAHLGSPLLKVFSGFYRTDLAGRPELITLERQYVVEVLRTAAPVAEQFNVTILLENCSDFTAQELESIIAEVDSDHVGVFLDLITPVGVLQEPVPMVRRLAPLAGRAVHVKDYALESVWTPDRFHRLGFNVRWCYPGEGVADLASLVGVVHEVLRHDEVFLVVEGLDSRADRADQIPRLRASFELLQRLYEGRGSHSASNRAFGPIPGGARSTD
jgi:sugar phosphate isomerase/epimerase